MKKSNPHNISELKQRRIELRNNPTTAEVALWKMLQGKQLDGRKFRRQHSVGSYVLDFYCVSEKLAVELDGPSHSTLDGIIYDSQRTEFTNQFDIRVLRFENKDVFERPEKILDAIRSYFKK